ILRRDLPAAGWKRDDPEARLATRDASAVARRPVTGLDDTPVGGRVSGLVLVHGQLDRFQAVASYALAHEGGAFVIREHGLLEVPPTLVVGPPETDRLSDRLRGRRRLIHHGREKRVGLANY